MSSVPFAAYSASTHRGTTMLYVMPDAERIMRKKKNVKKGTKAHVFHTAQYTSQ